MTATSATGCSSGHGRACGFTLIELLVVLLILGVVTTLVALTSAPDGRRAAANEAERLRVILEDAIEKAQIGGRPIAWIPEGTSYHFLQADLERHWRALTDDQSLRPRALPDGMRIAAVTVDGQPLPTDHMLIFASTTAPTFRIELDAPQGVFTLSALPNGRVDLLGPVPR